MKSENGWSLGLYSWALAVNPFFSPGVRIQEERGHRVTAGGPYRHVRHPGYLGGIASCAFGSAALGSGWAMLPVGVLALLLVRRTAVEDRFLQKELDGYASYARRVPYRLLPGLW